VLTTTLLNLPKRLGLYKMG